MIIGALALVSLIFTVPMFFLVLSNMPLWFVLVAIVVVYLLYKWLAWAVRQ